jgi:hypothetical protein
VLAQQAYFRGEFARGAELWAEVYEGARAHGNTLHVAWGLNGRAQALLCQGGDPVAAAGCLEEALAILARDADRISETTTHGLLAVARLRLGDRAGARSAADAGARLIAASGRPNGYYALEGYASVARVFLGLWEGGDARAAAPSRRACAALWRFAGVFRIARPRAWLCQGLAHWLAGRAWRARRAWDQAAAEACRLGMPYEEGLAHLEAGLRLPLGDPRRPLRLGRARQLFTRLGAARDLAATATAGSFVYSMLLT